MSIRAVRQTTAGERYMSNRLAVLRERIDIETALDIESFAATAEYYMLLSDVKPIVLI